MSKKIFIVYGHHDIEKSFNASVRDTFIEEAEKYAQLLGYNYGSSEWYQNTYSLFDKNYKIKKKDRFKDIKKENKKILKKFKSLFE